MKKLTSILMMGALLAWTGSAFAAQAPSAEINLLESAIALQGQNLSQQQIQSQMSTLMAGYAKTAPIQGQAERMEQALVAMNLYTPEQAHALMSSTIASSHALEASGFSTQEALQASTSSEIGSLVGAYPAGAQFSACTVGETFAAIGAAGLVTGGII